MKQWSVLLGVIGLAILPVRAETVALWLFDDPPGAEVAFDSSGNGYHLTLGPDAAIAEGGKFGRALNPDASQEDQLGAFRYKAEPALNPGMEDWTVEAWIKARPDMQGDNRIWGLSGVNYIDYGRGDNPSGLYVASRFLPIDEPDGWNRPTGDLKADQNFHHIAVVYDAGAKQLRHYFDGKLKFTAAGEWYDVYTGKPPQSEIVMPPHYPMLQVGMRDAYQQWDFREIHQHERHMKKFQGLIDEMRMSNEVVYSGDFTPPQSFAKPFLRVWPETVSVSVFKDESPQVTAKLNVAALGQGLEWNAGSGSPWAKAETERGQATAQGQDVRIAIDASSLQPGQHSAKLTFSAPGAENASVEIPVLLTVAERSAIRNVSNRKQLFIDQRFIESSENIELVVNQPVKVDIEFPNAHYPRNVMYLEDKGVWRMYDAPWSDLEYSESKDGIHWERSGGGTVVVVSDEDPTSVIERINFGATVMLDPHETDPAKRFKAFMEKNFENMDGDGYLRQGDQSRRSGIYGYYSADGIHFKQAGLVYPFMPEFVSPAPMWDDRINKYTFYFRVQNSKKPGLKSIQGNQFFYRPGFTYENPDGLVDRVMPETMFNPGFENLRSVGRVEMDNILEPWPLPPGITPESSKYATANQAQLVFTADEWDGFMDFYVHATHKYPYAEDVYLMFPTTFRHLHPSRQPWFYKFDDANGPLETTIAVSRDGIQWDRLERKPYIPMGRNDEWDRWRAMAGIGMVRNGNDLYQYYWGAPTLHDSVALRGDPAIVEENPNWRTSGIGAVKQRLDGFVSADAPYTGGNITTPPVVFSGSRLELNHNSGGTGTIFVELRDLNDQPLPGYTLADCEEISCDSVGWEVRWRGSGDLTALKGQPVRIHFKMANAKLYGFQFND